VEPPCRCAPEHLGDAHRRRAGRPLPLCPFGRFDIGAGILDDYPGTDGDGWHDGPELGILARGAAIEGAKRLALTRTRRTSAARAPRARGCSQTIRAARRPFSFGAGS